MIQFHDTVMGKRFFESTMPKLAETLKGIEQALTKQVEFNEEFRNAVEANQKVLEDDPLMAADNQYEAEYFEIDKFVAQEFPGDYEQGEAASLHLCECVIGLLKELKERRGSSES